MSIKQIFLLVAFGLSLGALGSSLYQTQISRNPASSDLLPAPKLKIWGHSPYGKMNQSISVKVLPVGGIPDRENQELTLRAEVTLHRPVGDELRFQWSLPRGASIVSGELEDAWPNLKPGQTATTEISLLGVSKSDIAQTVTLHVSGDADGVQYAAAGSFATNSAEYVDESSGDFSAGFLKVQKKDLVLKKSRSAEKLERLQQ